MSVQSANVIAASLLLHHCGEDPQFSIKLRERQREVQPYDHSDITAHY
ncbi:MAG: hypothetical protein F6K30_04260 [Cyanothece sp. SIO2G6]|nr:hypothetical protein [Cyanothece sp. SIO2G6]